MPKRKLLLADDSVTIQKVVNLTFTDEGFEVFTVGSGTAAMNMIGTVQPDLVLADVHMPGLTGYEVCEKIRQKPEFAHLPVILLVGSFEPFDEAEAERVGANDFLTKPFQSIRQLIEKVGGLLDAPKANLQTATAPTENVGDAKAVSAETAALADDDLDDAEIVNVDEIETVEQVEQDEIDGENVFGGEADDETIEIMSGDQIVANQNAESELSFDQILPDSILADDSFENRPTAPLSYADAEDSKESFAGAQVPTETAEAQIMDFDTNAAQPIFSESDNEAFGEMPASALAIEDSSAQYFDTISTENADQTMNLSGAESIAATTPTTDFSAFEIDFDDDSLLELDEEVEAPEPPIAETQADSHVEVMPPQNFAQDAGDTLMRPEMSAPAMSNQNMTFSPEMIDQIAQRVVEKLSDKVIEKIAWEIVPDRFDLIVRKHIDGRER